jgi:hypothetical protein
MKPEIMALIFGLIVVLFAVISKAIHNSAEKKKILKSARPSLTIETIKDSNYFIKIILKNTGPGSAFIENFELLFNSKLFTWNKKQGINSLLGQLGLNGHDVICNIPENDDILGAGETYFLFEANPVNKIEYDLISCTLEKLKYKIEYKSVYGEVFNLG